MSKAETAKRYILCIAGLFFAAVGVAFSKHGELGVSPISSVSNVLYCRFDDISLGMWLVIWNCVMIVGQVLILRRDFKLMELLQVPLSFLFGWFTDLGMIFVSLIPVDTYPVRLLMIIIGTVILSFGISLSVIANVIMNSGEAFVRALSDKMHKEFGYVKIGFDIFCVLLAVTLSMIFFDLTIVGVREGTVIAAVFTGIIVKFFGSILKKPLDRFLTGNRPE
ncbi:MAG: YitT family protein [Oscillospiraceae bacterium]|nr:YitT family protein [Oscillospiraceae bacterium]